jgi:hypothetical protein
MSTLITSAVVLAPDGRQAATIDRVPVGGGSQVVTVDGVPEERVHPASTSFHVRLLSPDRMLPDELRAVDSYDEAVALGELYASKLDAHASALASLAVDLKV